MNKTIAYIGVLLVMMASFVAAININQDCRNYDFDYGIAKYNCNNGVFSLDEGIDGYTFTFTGNCQSAYWTASPPVDGVIVKAATYEEITYEEIYERAKSGTVYCIENPQNNTICHDISYVLFCAMNGGECIDCDGEHEVPEFSTITLGLAILGAGLGLVFLRKQH